MINTAPSTKSVSNSSKLVRKLRSIVYHRVVVPFRQRRHMRVVKVRDVRGQEVQLRFLKSATIDLVKQSLCLQTGLAPDAVDLCINDRVLGPELTLGELGGGKDLRLHIRINQVTHEEPSSFAFSWYEDTFDPFKDNEVPPFALEKAEWLKLQNQAERESRLRTIETEIGKLELPANQLVAMTFDQGFASLFENWAESTRRHGIDVLDRCLVFAMDDESARAAERNGFRFCYDPGSRILQSTGTSKVYGDGEFVRHMFYQNAVIRDLLRFEVDVLFQDVDLVWLKDPLPGLDNHPSQAQFMFDGPTARHGPLCVNTGFMYLRADPLTREFWDIVYDRSEQVFYYQSQQVPVNKILGSINQLGFEVNVLDDDEFVNGHRIPINPSTGQLPPDPCVIHCSWAYELAGKLEKYRNYGIWYLDEPVPAA